MATPEKVAEVQAQLATLHDFARSLRTAAEARGEVQFGFHVPAEWGSVTPTSEDCCEQLEPLRGRESPTLSYQRLIIAGAQKCGTTFMTSLLVLHWQFRVSQCSVNKKKRLVKESHFFDNLYLSGDDVGIYQRGWEARLPILLRLSWFRGTVRPVLFESTPSYMRFPYVACRLRKLWTGVKLVFLLRNPAERAASQYRMDHDRGLRPRFFSEYVGEEIATLRQRNCTFQGSDASLERTVHDCYKCEFQRLGKYCYALVNQDRYETWQRPLQDYVTRGMYAPMLAWYLRYFRPSDMVILSFDEIQRDPVAAANKIAVAVGMSPTSFQNSTVFQEDGNYVSTLRVRPKSGKGSLTDELVADVEATKRMLYDYFYEPNQQLYKLLEEIGVKDFPRWEEQAPNSTELDK